MSAEPFDSSMTWVSHSSLGLFFLFLNWKEISQEGKLEKEEMGEKSFHSASRHGESALQTFNSSYQNQLLCDWRRIDKPLQDSISLSVKSVEGNYKFES